MFGIGSPLRATSAAGEVQRPLAGVTFEADTGCGSGCGFETASSAVATNGPILVGATGHKVVIHMLTFVE